MSRTKKPGLAYYPLDSNFFYNPKILSLSYKYPLAGTELLLRIFGDSYRNHGYYMIFDEDILDLYMNLTQLSSEKILEILNYLRSRNIFIIEPIYRTSLEIIESKKTKLKDLKIEELPFLITGENIQLQYQDTNKTMKRNDVPVDPNIWILSKSNTYSCIKVDSETKFKYLNLNKDYYSKFQNNPDNSGNNKNIRDNSSRNKSKENNKNKEKENKNVSPDNNYGIPISDFSKKEVFGEMNNVWLTQNELNILMEQYPELYNEIIEKLSFYKAANSKGYSSDYSAIKSWTAQSVEKGINSLIKGERISQERLKAIDEIQDEITLEFQKKLASY